MSGPLPPGRARTRRALIALAAATLLVVGLVSLPRPRPHAIERRLLALLEHVPADMRCGATVGRLAALAQGETLPDDDCLGELAEGAIAASLLTELVRDTSRPVAVRSVALSALLRADAGPSGLADALIAAPRTSPEMRRAAFAAAAEAGGVAWVERGGAAAVHGIHDRAIARLFAHGEARLAGELERALTASRWDAVDPALLADAFEGLGTDRATLEEAVARHRRGQAPLGLPSAWWPAFWRHGCEQGCVPLVRELLRVQARAAGEEPGAGAPPARPGADAALDVLYAEAGPAGDHVRRELAAVAAWIGHVSESRRAARLVAAVLHPDAPPADAAAASAEWGDPHAVLARGVGSPGATALVASDLALDGRVPFAARVSERGVALQVAGRHHVVEPCAAPRVVPALDEGWREVPLGGIDALALVEGAAQALLVGDAEAARLRVDAARAAWSEAPGLAAVEAAVLAFEGVPDPPPRPPVAPRRGRQSPPPAPPLVAVDGLLGVQAAESLIVSRPAPPARRGRTPAPAPDVGVERRASLRDLLARILALATEPADRLRASWWAAVGGEPELARGLLAAAGDPSALPAYLLPIRGAVARGIGEPAEAGPVPADAASVPAASGPSSAPETGGLAGAERRVGGEPRPVEGQRRATLPGACPAAFRADPPAWAFAGASLSVAVPAEDTPAR